MKVSIGYKMEKQMQGEWPHKRRVRYKGTHPRKYS